VARFIKALFVFAHLGLVSFALIQDGINSSLVWILKDTRAHGGESSDADPGRRDPRRTPGGFTGASRRSRRQKQAGHRRHSASDHDHHRPEPGRGSGKVSFTMTLYNAVHAQFINNNNKCVYRQLQTRVLLRRIFITSISTVSNTKNY